MKGLVLNLLEECVREAHGEDVWDDLLDAAGLDGAYTALGTYPDEHLYALVRSASAKLGLADADVIRWFGQEAARRFAARYPELYRVHRDARSFLLSLNSIVHPHVRATVPEADVPEFVFGTEPDGALRMEYHSRRPLCAFAEGLVHGTADHFHQRAEVRQTTCTHRGDPYCTLVVSLESVTP